MKFNEEVEQFVKDHNIKCDLRAYTWAYTERDITRERLFLYTDANLDDTEKIMWELRKGLRDTDTHMYTVDRVRWADGFNEHFIYLLKDRI